MKKLESSLTNMALVLTIIAVVAGAALAAVNAVTAPQIEKINADNLAAGIKAVMGSDDIQVAEPQEVEGFTSYAVIFDGFTGHLSPAVPVRTYCLPGCVCQYCLSMVLNPDFTAYLTIAPSSLRTFSSKPSLNGDTSVIL